MPLQPFLHFSDPSFSASVPLRYPSTITNYLEHLRATNAMEHVLLDFVRWQDTPSNESSGSFGGGPTRLNDWFGVTQPCSRNQPLDQGSTTGSNLAVEPAP